MGTSSTVPIIVPSPAEVISCAKCVPTSRNYVRIIAYLTILLSVAIAVMVWFIAGDTTILYVCFALALLLAIAGGVLAFGLELRCAPCNCN